MKNKKKLLYIIPLFALILLFVLYLIFNYSEPNVLNSKDKEWIKDNGGKLVDIAVINNIPIYGNDGKGVIFDYLDFMSKESTLEFNKIPYLLGGEAGSADYRVEYIDGDINPTDNQLLIYDVEKEKQKIIKKKNDGEEMPRRPFDKRMIFKIVNRLFLLDISIKIFWKK